MRRRTVLIACGAVALVPRLSFAGPTPSRPGAKEYIIWPHDGAVVKGGFWIRMGLRNMGLCPKGIDKPNVGHHHLIIDADLPPMDQPIPSDRNHLHFGAGESEARIELTPGRHTLQLLLGDYNHAPHNPPVYSKKITVMVKEGGSDTPSDRKPVAYIGWPNDGESLPAGKPFRIWFGLRNMGVAPSGVRYPNTGHHHLLIDTDLPPLNEKIPSDRNHLHFGGGETETTLELPPGKHTLQLLLGDSDHIPQNPPVYSKKITVHIK